MAQCSCTVVHLGTKIRSDGVGRWQERVVTDEGRFTTLRVGRLSAQ